MYDRLVCFVGFLGCCLVGLFGLSHKAYANMNYSVFYPLSSEAMTACSNFATQRTTRPYGNINILNGSPTANCYNDSDNLRIIGFHSYAMTSNPGKTCYNYITTPGTTAACNSNFTPNDRLVYFTYEEDDLVPAEDCSTKEKFDSASMGPPRDANNQQVFAACFEGCAYDIFGGFYMGTYPHGYVYYEFHPTGSSCEVNQSTPEPGVIPAPGDPDYDPILDLPPDDGGFTPPSPDPGPGADENGKGQSSGGATCDAAPQCTGDSLQCNVLYQTWATRCAVVALDNDGGSSDGVVDAVESLEGSVNDMNNSLGDKITASGSAIVDAIASLNGGISNLGTAIGSLIGDWSEIWDDSWQGDPGPGSDGDFSSLTANKTISSDSFDTSGWGLPRSCPYTQDPSFDFMGETYTIGLTSSGICNIFVWMGYLIVAFASFTGSMILIRD